MRAPSWPSWRRTRASGRRPPTSVFFGGGTPSLLPARTWPAILDAVAPAPGPRSPSSATPRPSLRRCSPATGTAGVTRMSFGVQSMVPDVLAALGPGARPRRGAPGRGASPAGRLRRRLQRRPDLRRRRGDRRGWQQSLAGVLGLDPAPAHVSAYALTVEARHPAGPGPRPPSRPRRPGRQVRGRRRPAARRAGMRWYEISNWARPGRVPPQPALLGPG